MDSRLGKIGQPSPDEHQRILEKIGFAYFVLHAYPTLATRLPRFTSAKDGFEALRVTVPDLIIPNLKDILAVLEPPESVRIIQPGYRH